MKKIIIILFLPSLLFSSDFSQFSSVNIDLVGVVASGDKIAAYGTNGSVYYSDDDSQTWDIIKPFNTGNIVGFFIESDRLVAFLQTGEVSQSYDNGISWTVTNPIKDSVSYVIKGDDVFFIRSKNAIIKLNDDLSFDKSSPYPCYRGFDITYSYVDRNRMTMAYLNNKLYLIDIYSPNSLTDFVILDKNLNLIDTVSLSNKFFNDNLINNYWVASTSKHIIIGIIESSSNTYKGYQLDEDISGIKVLLNINDSLYKQQKMFGEEYQSIVQLEIYNNKIYTIITTKDVGRGNLLYKLFELVSQDSAKYIESLGVKNIETDKIRHLYIDDYVIKNERITGVGKNNLLVSKKFNSKNNQQISNLAGADNYSKIFKINDSDFLLITNYKFYKSSDTAKTFTNVEGDTSVFRSYLKYATRFSFYPDDAKKILYFAYSQSLSGDFNGLPYVLISEDYGEHFSSKQLEGLNLKNLANSYSIVNVNNNYLISETNFGNNKVNYFVYDEKFDLTDSILDSKYFLLNGFGKNITEFKALGRPSNFDDAYKYILSTEDGGKSWNEIRKFDYVKDTVWYNEEDSTKFFTTNKNELQYYKTLKINNREFWIFTTYNLADSLYKIEAMDIETNEFTILYQNKQSAYSNTLIELIGNEYYICKDDILYTTSDLFDFSSWKGHQLPNNGTMTTKIMKSGNYLITYYYDDVLPFEIYRIKWDDLIHTSIKSEDIETYNYFYSTPPYPQPTSNLVTVDVYLENGTTLSANDIGIYNLEGNLVENGKNILLTGNNWPTKLTWDSSEQPSGVYFIVMKYGNSTKSVKVMVD